MIDAYEIGITLALDNGAEMGIAAIRRDLAALDRAVAVSSNGLLTLRNLAESLTVSTPDHMPSPPTTPAPLRAPPSEAVPEAPATLSQFSTAAAVVPSSHKLTTTPALSAAGSSSLPPQVQISTPAIQHVSPPTQVVDAASIRQPLPPPRIASASPNAPFLPAPVLAADLPHLANIPSKATASHLGASPIRFSVPPIVHSEPKSVPEPLQIPAVSTTAPQPSHTQVLQIAHAPFSAPFPASPAQPSSKRNFFPTALRPTAPISSILPAVRVDGPETAFKRTAPVTPSETKSVHNPGASHGEIILDSARLGRWISDYLARAANRPQSGATGFDSRVSPNYAGAPNGS